MKYLKYFEGKKWTIYCDMDGVICDWDEAFERLILKDWNEKYKTNITSGYDFERVYGRGSLWEYVDALGVEFWSELKWKPDGKELWDFILPYNPIILSKPTYSPNCKIGKKIWCEREIPGTKVILERKKDKYARPCAILIDDTEKNILEWEKAGGLGILHTSAEDTIQKLNQLL